MRSPEKTGGEGVRGVFLLPDGQLSRQIKGIEPPSVGGDVLEKGREKPAGEVFEHGKSFA